MRLEITTLSEVPPGQLEEARRRIAALARHSVGSPTPGRLALRRAATTPPYEASASVVVGGRVIAAHAHGRSAGEAVDAVVRRLQRQAQALSGGPSFDRVRSQDGRLPTDIRPQPRANATIVHRRPYLAIALTTLEAVAELVSLDARFFYFRHERTTEDVCLDRFMNGRIGLIFPPGSVLADENDLIVGRPSRYLEPLPLTAALEELVLARHRFMYFVDAADERAKVLYIRHDGDYGLVEPA
jgi:hypothetical protein